MKLILETERLILREMNYDDFESLQKIISDPVNMKYYAKPYNEAGVKRWIDWNTASYAKRGFGLWAAILKETGEMIGDCGVTMQNIDGVIVPEIGYHFRLDYHNRHLATEASQAVKDYFFSHFDYDEVYSYMDKENWASRKVAINNGMSFIKEYPENNEYNEITVVYKITKAQWQKEKAYFID